MILRQPLLAALLVLPAAIRAQTLAFLNPTTNALTALGGSINYTVGEDVDVRWETDYVSTTLRIWQGPLEDGSYVNRVLAENYTTDQTSYTYRTRRLDAIPLSHPFHFQLQDGEDRASVDSVNFYINRVESSSSSSSSMSSTTSAARTSTLSSMASNLPAIVTSGSDITTISGTSTASMAGAAMTAATSESTPALSNDHHSPDLAVPLGVGLGVGIPVLLAIIALLLLCCTLRRRKKRRQADNLPRGRHAVKRSAEGPIPVSAVPMSERQTQSSDRNPLRPQHIQHPEMPYFPSGGAPYYSSPSRTRDSGGSHASRASQNSYFEPFDFERPGSQDFETRSVMSEMTGHAHQAAGARLASIDEDTGPAGSRGAAQGTFFESESPPESRSGLMAPHTPPGRSRSGTPEWPLPPGRLATPNRRSFI